MPHLTHLAAKLSAGDTEERFGLPQTVAFGRSVLFARAADRIAETIAPIVGPTTIGPSSFLREGHMGILSKLMGVSDKKIDLIRRLTRHRSERDAHAAAIGMSPADVDRLGIRTLLGLPEATVVTNVESWAQLQAQGMADPAIARKLSAIRGGTPTDSVEAFIVGRIYAEHGHSGFLPVEHVRWCIDEAKLAYDVTCPLCDEARVACGMTIYTTTGTHGQTVRDDSMINIADEVMRRMVAAWARPRLVRPLHSAADIEQALSRMNPVAAQATRIYVQRAHELGDDFAKSPGAGDKLMHSSSTAALTADFAAAGSLSGPHMEDLTFFIADYSREIGTTARQIIGFMASEQYRVQARG